MLSWAPLIFALQVVANLLCSRLCLFDAIVELGMTNCAMTFSLEVTMDFICNKGLLSSNYILDTNWRHLSHLTENLIINT